MAIHAILAILYHICLAFGADDYVVKEYHRAPAAWRDIGRAPEHHNFILKIGLTQRDFAELERQIYEVSDPNHARYGQYLSQAAIHDLVTPHPDVHQAVEDWLENAGFDSDQWEYNTAKTWISLPISVAEAESLLDTTYSTWEHNDGTTLVRTQSWSLPASLHPHITTIQPTNSWARMKPNVPVDRRSSHVLEAPASLPDIPPPPDSAIAALCNFSSVTPDCIRTLYGTASYTPKTNASQIGICNYLGETNNRTDTALFLAQNRPDAVPGAELYSQISIAGGPIWNGSNTADAGSGLEGNLDIQYVLGIAYPLPVTTWSTGGLNPDFMPSINTPYPNTDEPYLTWTNYILSQPTIPPIITTSYGDDEQTVSYSYAVAVCNEFAQITARGVTLLFSSGDYGVGADGTCYSNKDNATYQFLPSFPASCPFVTSVGGTKNYPEVAVGLGLHSGARFRSGAGFSNYFGAPNYQKDTVGKYVASLNGTYNGFYNKSGRAYPDISCIGQIFPTIWNGSEAGLVGTSGSSPICAAVLSFANDALLARGRPTLGFLNPWLYSGGYEAFTDVTSGDSAGCNTTGFPATVGWDAVTGFGTPYLPSVLKVLNL